MAKIDKAVVDYLKKNNLEPAGKVNAGLAPDYSKGAVIMGVYELANQSAPVSRSPIPCSRSRARRYTTK